MALRLELFETAEESAQTVVTDSDTLEEQRLAAYEQGYGAGWEDAVAAQATDAARVHGDLARNLQSLGFTYHEARVHVLRALEPLLHEIVARLLPRIAQEALVPVVLEVLLPLADRAAIAPVTLVFNPASRMAIEAVIAGAAGLPLVMKEEPTLGEGQVHLRLGDTETDIDLDRAVADIGAAVHAFFDTPRQERVHG